MANYAYLIGHKADKQTLVAYGLPVEIRRQFKDMTAKDGYDLVEVLEKHLGRTRHRKFVKVEAAKKAAKKSTKKS